MFHLSYTIPVFTKTAFANVSIYSVLKPGAVEVLYTDKGHYTFTIKCKDAVSYEVLESDNEIEFNFITAYFIRILEEHKKLVDALPN